MERSGLIAILILMGAGWGITQSFSKIAISTGHQPFGLVFWQLVISGALLGVICFWRGRWRLPMRDLPFFTVIALIGTVLPNATSYLAIQHLPAGVMSILIAAVPMFAFPLALILGMDRFSALRLLGLILGLAGVVLLVAPEASLPDPAMVWWVPLGLVAPFFYAIEGNYVAFRGNRGLDAVQILFGASVVGAILALPLALISGHWIDPRPPWGAAEAALAGSSLIHGLVYSAYVWMVGRAGAVFTAQVSYLVTLFGIIWAMLILGESYSQWIWAALAVMLAGLFLVQPRGRQAPK